MKQAVKAVLKDQEENKGSNNSELVEKLQSAEIDLYYVVKFPLEEKYISLYPTSDANDPETTKARKDFLEELKVEVKSGTLPSGIHPKKKVSKAYFEVGRIRQQGSSSSRGQDNQDNQSYRESAAQESKPTESVDYAHGEDEFFA